MITDRTEPRRVVALYADGGVVSSLHLQDRIEYKASRSVVAGSWAWCMVDQYDQLFYGESGLVLPSKSLYAPKPQEIVKSWGDERGQTWQFIDVIEDETVTNNCTEMVALVRGMEHLPPGFAGTIYSDSQITLGRVFKSWAMNGITDEWRLRAMMSHVPLGNPRYRLLDGHPTRQQLADGKGKRGNLVSKWNKWCDTECGKVGKVAQKLSLEKWGDYNKDELSTDVPFLPSKIDEQVCEEEPQTESDTSSQLTLYAD